MKKVLRTDEVVLNSNVRWVVSGREEGFITVQNMVWCVYSRYYMTIVFSNDTDFLFNILHRFDCFFRFMIIKITSTGWLTF